MIILLINEKQREEVKEKIKQEPDTSAAKTEILYGADNIVKRTIGDFHIISQRLDNCTDYTGPSVFYNTPIWKEFVELKNRGIKLRFITEITNNNINYSKELSKVAELYSWLEAHSGFTNIPASMPSTSSTNSTSK